MTAKRKKKTVVVVVVVENHLVENVRGEKWEEEMYREHVFELNTNYTFQEIQGRRKKMPGSVFARR